MMSSAEKQRILQMVSDGTLNSTEAARLLAAVTEREEMLKPKSAPSAKREPDPKSTQTIELQRKDGSHYSMDVPAGLAPALAKTIGLYIKESAKTATRETIEGMKAIAINKANEVKSAVRGRRGAKSSAPLMVTEPPHETKRREARKRVLEMLHNGRLDVEDATNLIEQLDSFFEPETE